jgi:hypothetical protein
MPCPHASGDTGAGEGRLDRLLERRTFLRSALAIGGSTALSACIEQAGMPAIDTGNPSKLPARQHAWNEYLPRDAQGNTRLPHHQLIILLEYDGSGVPTEPERRSIDEALESLERAYLWGNGQANAYRTEGVPGIFYLMGYSNTYFDRFESSPADFQRPETVLSAVDESTEKAGNYDAVLLLTSDHVQILLAIEQALFGNLDTLNGISVTGSFSPVFSVRERRSGFVGVGKPHRRLDDRIPEDSPLSMGFKSGLNDNQAAEDRVTLENRPFAGGTTLQLSRLTIDLDNWYERPADERRHLMFSPHHTESAVGEAGELLGAESGVTEAQVEQTAEHAQELHLIGHTQKAAAARDDDFEPKILRRSESVSNEVGDPGFNFSSLQRSLDAFIEVRRAMNGEHFDDDQVASETHGILDAISVQERATFLVPPRDQRALVSIE